MSRRSERPTKPFAESDDMANPATDKVPPPENGATAAFLSYLVPGLGQIYQGRIGKGILFFVCVYTLFFYGMYLGQLAERLPGSHHEPPE